MHRPKRTVVLRKSRMTDSGNEVSRVGKRTAHRRIVKKKMPRRAKKTAATVASSGSSSAPKNNELFLSEAPFQRVVGKILDKKQAGLSCEMEAMKVIQKLAEAFLIGLFKESQFMAKYAHRVTIMPEDMQIAIALRIDHMAKLLDGRGKGEAGTSRKKKSNSDKKPKPSGGNPALKCNEGQYTMDMGAISKTTIRRLALKGAAMTRISCHTHVKVREVLLGFLVLVAHFVVPYAERAERTIITRADVVHGVMELSELL